jgi:FlaA1/EpsC-like NDP-sugar epimerase
MRLKNNTILVTGADGCIGSRLIKVLVTTDTKEENIGTGFF